MCREGHFTFPKIKEKKIMSQVHVNPEELRTLGNVLIQCSVEVGERVSRMRNAVSGCSSWHDPKKQQLEAAIDELYPQILGFQDAINEQFQYLYALASKADEYLST
jgi:hypothetical protein